MPRPVIYREHRVATAIRLPVSLRDELRRAATTRDVSVNFLVTRAISEFLERLPDPTALEGQETPSLGAPEQIRA